ITTGLDIESQLEMINLLKQEIKDKGMTLILVSHNLNEIKELCERIIFIDKGLIIEDTQIDKILENHKTLLDYYLEKISNNKKEGN
ncbi:ABC transporter ATP-binding protein, partial [Escherichia coli]|nr:ABC transporter ATP-binding protein [Escherichia coli]